MAECDRERRDTSISTLYSSVRDKLVHVEENLERAVRKAQELERTLSEVPPAEVIKRLTVPPSGE